MPGFRVHGHICTCMYVYMHMYVRVYVQHNCEPTVLGKAGGEQKEASDIVSISSVQWKLVRIECYRTLIKYNALAH